MEPAELRRAVEAGRVTAAELGLQAEDAVVIHNSDRVVLRLVPCDVLARVAPSGQLAAAAGAFSAGSFSVGAFSVGREESV